MDELIEFIEQDIIAPGGSDQYPDVINIQDEFGIRNSTLPLETHLEDQSEKSAGDTGVPDYLELSPSNLEHFLRQTQGFHEDPPELENDLFSENDDDEEDLDLAAQQLEFLLGDVNKSPEHLADSGEETETLTKRDFKQNQSTKELLERVGNASPSWALDVGSSQGDVKPKVAENEPCETTCHDYFHRPRVPSPKKQRKPSSPRPLQENGNPVAYNIIDDVFLEHANEKINDSNVSEHSSNIQAVPNSSFKAEQILQPQSEGTDRLPSVEDVPKTFYCRELGRELSLFNYHQFPEDTQGLILQQMRAGKQVIRLPNPAASQQGMYSFAAKEHSVSFSAARTLDITKPVDGASLLHEAAMAAGLLDSGSEGSIAEPSIRKTLMSPLQAGLQSEVISKERNTVRTDSNEDSGQMTLKSLVTNVDVTNEHLQTPVSPFLDTKSSSEMLEIGSTKSPQHENPRSPDSEDLNSFDALSYLNDLLGNENQQRVDTHDARVSDQLDILAELNQVPLEDNFASQEDNSVNLIQGESLGSDGSAGIFQNCLDTGNKSLQSPEDKPPSFHTNLLPYTGEDGLDDERYFELISEPTAHIPGYESNATSSEIDDFMNQHFHESMPNTNTELSEALKTEASETSTVALVESVAKDDSFVEDGRVVSSYEHHSDPSTIPFDVPGFVNNDSVNSGHDIEYHAAMSSPEAEWKNMESFEDLGIGQSGFEEEKASLNLQQGETTPKISPIQPENGTPDAFDEINKYLSSLN